MSVGVSVARRRDRISWIIGAVVGALFIAMGIFLAARDIWATNDARDWVAAKGQVVATSITTHPRSSSRRSDHTPRMTYRYQVGGRTYASNYIWLADPRSFNERGEAAAFLSAYPVGAVIDIFHDPADPQRAVVIREAGGRPSAGYVMAGFGLVLMLFALFFLRRHSLARRDLLEGARSL